MSKHKFVSLYFVFFTRYLHRCESESETTDTDEDKIWGGCGKFEYSQKALPHALRHYTELVMRAGHHGAYCTAAVEMGHIAFNAKAATLTRHEASKNRSESNMLQWNLQQQLYAAVLELRDKNHAHTVVPPDADDESQLTLSVPLKSCKHGWDSHDGIPKTWGNKFVSTTARLTRLELLYLLGNKLRITGVQRRLQHFDDIVLLGLKKLSWEFFGVMSTRSQKRVGTEPRMSRRDFVLIEDDLKTRTTCLAAQLLMFVQVTGFRNHVDICLPNDEDSRTYGLIRWLCPHPNALVRDDMKRPMCPPPMDINHALWKFAEEDRHLLTQDVLKSHCTCYPGSTVSDQVTHMHSEKRAWFGLVELQTIKEILNCTNVDNDLNTILQTITIPFQ